MALQRIGRIRTAALTAAASAAVLGGCVIVVDADSGSTSWIAGPQFVHSWVVELDEAELASHPQLHIINASGDVTLKATEGPARIEVETYSRDRDRARRVKIDIQKTVGGTLAIEPDWPGGIRSNESCDLIVYVQNRDGIRIRVGAGEIEVEGMAGGMNAETGAGEIEVRSHDGSVSLHTGAGDIEAKGVAGSVEAETRAGDIDLSNVGWPVEATSGAGDISVTLRHGFSGQLHASTSAGGIELPGVGTTHNRGATRSATNYVGEPGSDQECVLKTSAGDVSVRVLPPTD